MLLFGMIYRPVSPSVAAFSSSSAPGWLELITVSCELDWELPQISLKEDVQAMVTDEAPQRT